MRYFAAGLAMLLAGVAVGDDKANAELKKMQGTWKVVAAEKDGDSFDRIVGGVMVVKDNHFDIKTKAGTELKGDLVLDPDKKPKTINYAHQEGPLRENTWEGIYEIDGDKLKVIYAEAEGKKDRPTEFKTTKGCGHLLLEFERVKR